MTPAPRGLTPTRDRLTMCAGAADAHVHSPDADQATRRRGSRRAEWTSRLQTWWSGPELDRPLAEGSHPEASPALSLRAAHLTGTRHRQRLAETLEAIIAAAREPPRLSAPAVPVCSAAVREAEDDLLALAAGLRSGLACRPHAAALASFLVSDARSPVYYDRAHVTPAQLARAALAGLHAP